MKLRRAFLILAILALSLSGLTACEQEPQLGAAGISKQSHEWVFAKKLTSTGPVDFDSTLNADGAVTFASTLGVTGASTLTGAVAANGGITVDSTAFIVADTSGNVSTAGTLGVTGASTLGGAVTINDNATVTGTLGVGGMMTALRKVITKTGVTVALTAAEVQGSFVSDLGDTGAITITLPTAVAGYEVILMNVTGNDWIIDVADSADTIFDATNAAGNKITNTTAYDYIHLVAIDATGYWPIDVHGTWTDAD